MKNFGKQLSKILISGVIAFIALTLFCMAYQNVPIHHTNEDGATDYVWQANKAYISLTEGLGFGKTNNEGLMNPYDYEEGMDIDVLMMGSSHLQGFTIDMSKNCSVLLSEELNETVYNIAVTGHNFKTCVSNLDAALNRYNPKTVVIETSNLVLSDENINKILKGEIKEIPSISNPVINMLQKNPFLRQSYDQIQSLLNSSSADEDTTSNTVDEINSELTDELLVYIKNIADKYNTKVIIMYHPTVTLTDDGLTINNNPAASKVFNELCKENGISFLDMSTRYEEEFKKDYTVPTGFINTSVGLGHINEEGHRLMAEELGKIIKEAE